MLDFEDQYYSKDIKFIVGVDEAGRGPLAGPVVASAVILPHDYKNELINDSKKLTKKQREKLYLEIFDKSLAIGVGIVEAIKIDEINIYEATKLAMKEAISSIKHEYQLILIDAMKLDIDNIKVIPIIKGDAKARCIAAASIIAKVTRDNIMNNLDKKYSNYGFKNHKGYGTKYHIEAIKKYGLIECVHRKTFKIKSLNKFL